MTINIPLNFQHVIVAKMFGRLPAPKTHMVSKPIPVRVPVADCWTVRSITVRPSVMLVSASPVSWQ